MRESIKEYGVKRMKKKFTTFDGINTLIMIVITFLALYPLWYIIVISFSTEGGYYRDIYHIIPNSFTFENYKAIVREKVVFTAFGQSTKVTLIGTAFSLVLTSFAGYAFSKTRLPGVNVLFKLALVTMYVSGGIVPMYLLITNLGLKNTIWSLILPGMINTYNVILMKNYFQSLPISLEEAAKIDGASEFQTFLKIIIPLSMPILATIALFYAVAYWNAYIGAVLYLSDSKKFTLPAVLRSLLMAASKADEFPEANKEIAAAGKFDQGMNMASIIVSVIPIMIVYPFLQKYFAKGLMLGAVKG